MLKKIFVLFMFFGFLTCFFSENAMALSTSAKSAILVSSDNFEVLYSKNEKEKLSMASTTKIMTALLALEFADFDNREITVTKEMITVEGSSMGLKEGDILTIENLTKGMLMSSGNDAANTLAISIGGDTENFVSLMNERAKQLGMLDTSFQTPSGLDDDNHYSTAYDMAILGAYAMENDKFSQIVSGQYATVEFVNPQKKVKYTNHNRLVSMYKGCIGIKTGFTKKSGRCLVSCAERDGLRLIAVTLNAPDDWNDHIAMYNYGFSCMVKTVLDDRNSIYSCNVANGEKDCFSSKAEETATVYISDKNVNKIQKNPIFDENLTAPIATGDIVGYIEYTLDDKVLAKIPLIAQEDVKAKDTNIFVKLFNFIFNGV